MACDIAKAFLQGVIYEELAEVTDEPIRVVNLETTPKYAEALQQVPGFEKLRCCTTTGLEGA